MWCMQGSLYPADLCIFKHWSIPCDSALPWKACPNGTFQLEMKSNSTSTFHTVLLGHEFWQLFSPPIPEVLGGGVQNSSGIDYCTPPKITIAELYHQKTENLPLYMQAWVVRCNCCLYSMHLYKTVLLHSARIQRFTT